MKNMAFNFIIFFLITGCTTVKPPVWVKEFGTRTFSKDGIEGIGFAKFNKKDKSTLPTARESAYNEAIKNLAVKLKTEVKGTIEHQMQDKITYIDKKYQQQASDKIDSLTNIMFETILGRKYFEEYIDYKNSLYWVYVWTTKAELQRAIQEELEKQEIKNNAVMRTCLQQYRNVDSLITEGKIVPAVKLLEDIFTQLKEVKGICVIEKTDNITLQMETKEKIGRLINSVELKPVDTTYIETLKDVPIDVDLTVECKFNWLGKKYPVVFLPLKLNFVEGSGETDDINLTDDNGIAKFKIYKLTSKNNVIEITPAVTEIKQQLSDTYGLENRKIVYRIVARSLRETKKIFVKISSGKEDLTNVLKTELVAQLKKKDFNIVESNYDYIMYVTFDTEYIGDELTLPDGTKKKFVEMYSGNVSSELKSLDDNIVVSKTFVGLKGFGRTKKEAEQDLLKKFAESLAEYMDKNF